MDISTTYDSTAAQVKLFYEVFGFSPTEIAQYVGKSKAVVELMIEEGQYQQSPFKFTSSAESDEARNQLINVIMRKQMLFAPAYAQTEFLILQKITDVVKHIDPEDTNAPKKLELLAKTTATLNQATVAAILSQVSQSKAQDNGMKIELINTFSS